MALIKQFKNSTTNYGWFSIALHWVIALLVLGLFALGMYMVRLNYSSPWYYNAPLLHQSLGVVLVLLVVIRTLWCCYTPAPMPLASHKRAEIMAAASVKWIIAILLWIIFVSGYIIITAKGETLAVFDWFSLPGMPAYVRGLHGLTDYAGFVHRYCAYVLIGVIVLHTLAVVKHYFIDKDNTFGRMMGKM